MNSIDRAILEHGRDDFRPLTPLRAQIPSGTLYRHIRGLLQRGWLRKDRGSYRTTDARLRQLAESAGGRQWDHLTRVYPPLALVPTAVHGALIELIFAAGVARQHPNRDDRHPFFVAFGGTLHWKTSLGVFVCHALGLDPARQIVDCGAEAGKSLSFRRTGTGALASKRELLDTPFVVLDEVLTAEPAVRATLNIFLSGRRVMPVENESLTVRPVPLLTLNPRQRDTLEERIGLSAPQIRRAILANLDAVPMPDLALMGERAITAARTAPPLTLAPPAVDCRAFHRPIVELLRAVLRPEAQERLDVELVVNLTTGMTAFLPEPAPAIAQVGHALGVVLETLGWTRPGWIDPVSRFTLDPPRVHTPSASATAAVVAVSEPPRAPADRVPPRSLALQVPRPAPRDSGVPDLVLDDALKAKLIWFAVDIGLPLQAGLWRLLNFYLYYRRKSTTFEALAVIVKLAETLEVIEVDVQTLREYLEVKAKLQDSGCSFEDVPDALQLIELLDALPQAWTWAQARRAIRGVATLLRAGIDGQQLEAFLERHQRLGALGLDEATAEVMAKVLAEAQVPAARREAVLHALVTSATETVDRDALTRERARLQAEVAHLEAQRTSLLQVIKGLKTRLLNLQTAEADALRRKQQLDACPSPKLRPPGKWLIFRR